MKKLLFGLFLFLAIGFVLAADFTPQGDINLRNTYEIKNATNISAAYYCDLGSANCYDATTLSSGTVYYAGGSYIYKNGSNYFIINETVLNATISALDTNTQLSGAQVVALVGNWTAWDNFTGIPTATPSNGDTTHLSTADQIYDWVIGLSYATVSQLSNYVQTTSLVGLVGNWSLDKTNYYNSTQTDTQIVAANTSMKGYVDANEADTYVASECSAGDFVMNITGDTMYCATPAGAVGSFVEVAGDTMTGSLNISGDLNVTGDFRLASSGFQMKQEASVGVHLCGDGVIDGGQCILIPTQATNGFYIGYSGNEQVFIGNTGNTWFESDGSLVVEAGSNITAGGYFLGDGSLLTGITADNSSWNQTLADTLYAAISVVSNPFDQNLNTTDSPAFQSLTTAGGSIGIQSNGTIYGVSGYSPSGKGVYGLSGDGTGVYGVSTSSYGTLGLSTSGVGAFGQSTNWYGISGYSTNSYGGWFDSGGPYSAGFNDNITIKSNSIHNVSDIGTTADEIENVYIEDNKRIYFGNGQDASIYYNGTNLIISG